MTQLNVTDLCKNITETFRSIPELRTVYDIDQILDSIPPNDMPLLMVYPNETTADEQSGTQMTTFGGGAIRPIQVEGIVIACDVYIGTQGGLPVLDAITSMLKIWDAVNEKVRLQTIKPYFGDVQIKAFSWTLERSTLIYNQKPYWGLTLELTITEF